MSDPVLSSAHERASSSETSGNARDLEAHVNEKGENAERPSNTDGVKDAAVPAGDSAGAAGVDRGAEHEAGRSRLETVTVMLALCSALLLAALDMTIVATAVPTIAADFNSDLGYVWIGTAYLLVSAAFIPTWGKLSDIWGRKPVLLVAVAVFWVGSLICGLSTNIAMLIAGRSIQGLGSGAIIVLVNICVGDLFSVRARGLYYGILAFVWSFASAIGPILGGVFTTKATWRWCFYVNLPISGVAMVVLLLVLKLHNPRTNVVAGLAAVDWVGSLLIISGTVMLLFGLQFGGVQYSWSSAIVVCLIVFGLFTILLFALWEWRVPEYPIMPMRLFRNRSNDAALLLTAFHALVFMSAVYYLPLYFQAVLGKSALLSGVYLLPFVLGLSFMAVVIGIVIKKTGNYKIGMVTATVVMTIGVSLFVDLGTELNIAKLILIQVVAGIGCGPNFQSPLIALHTTVEPSDIATATATLTFVRQIMTAISIAIGGVVFNNEMQRQAGSLHAQLPASVADRLSGNDAVTSVGFVASLTGPESVIAREAYWTSLRTMYIMFAVFAAAAFVSSLFVRQTRLSQEHKEHKTGIQSMRARTHSPSKAP